MKKYIFFSLAMICLVVWILHIVDYINLPGYLRAILTLIAGYIAFDVTYFSKKRQ